MSTLKCAGCGADKDERDLAPIEVAVGHTVDVCRWRGSKLNDCARKARQDVCPGCGRSFRGDGAAPRSYVSGLSFEARIACADCVTVLAKGRQEMARPVEEARKFAHLDGRGILGRAVFALRDSYDRGREFAKILARVTGGRTERLEGERWSSHGYVPSFDREKDPFGVPNVDSIVEVTAAQYEALCELAHALAGILSDARAAGFAEGEDLLGKLASGRVTVAAYEDEAARGRKKEDR